MGESFCSQHSWNLLSLWPAQVGVGRDDGVIAGEFNPVFYRRWANNDHHGDDVFIVSVLHSSYSHGAPSGFRTSQWFQALGKSNAVCRNEPFEPSKYPGAGSFRICTAARFSSIASGNVFTVLNTHLDDQSDEQRRLAASMLLTRARYEAANTTGPVFVIGDFNRCVLPLLASILQWLTKTNISALPEVRILAHTISLPVRFRPWPSIRPLRASTLCKMGSFQTFACLICVARLSGRMFLQAMPRIRILRRLPIHHNGKELILY